MIGTKDYTAVGRPIVKSAKVKLIEILRREDGSITRSPMDTGNC